MVFRRFFSSFLCSFLFGLAVFQLECYAAVNNFRILLLNSYHPQYQWTADLSDGVKSELLGFIPPENLHIEYMDERRFVSDPDYHQKISQLLEYKYRNFPIDLIISSDDAAFYFLIKNEFNFAQDKPVVFGGVNVLDVNVLQGRTNFTGVLEGMEIKDNINLIQSLQPEVSRVVLLADKSELGVRMRQQAIKDIKQVNNLLQIEIWDDFSFDYLLKMAAQMPQDTVFLLLAIHKDNQGRYFSFEHELKKLTEISRVPVYGMWGSVMINQGVIGGMMNNPYQHGSELAKIAKEILNGQAVSSIPIKQKSEFVPTFNYMVLEKFNINKDYLPAGSLIHNQPDGFYRKYSVLINLTLFIVALLSAVVVILSFNINRRKKVEALLSDLNRDLEQRVKARTKELASKNVELESMMQNMKYLANTDVLTELPNRRAGMKRLQKLQQRYSHSRFNLSVAMIDIDYFKNINDCFGHDIGDQVLKQTADVLQDLIRPSDFAIRWGGEEFLLLLPNANIQEAYLICTRIQAEVKKIVMADNSYITLSIGLAEHLASDNTESLLKRADENLYYAKGNGRNRIEAETRS